MVSPARTMTGQQQDLQRRVASLEAKAIRPEAAQSTYDRLPKGIARKADGTPAVQVLTGNGGPYGNLATTDFVLTDVVVDASRLYRVHIHSQVAPTGSTSPASGLHLALFVDGVDTERLMRKRFEGAGGNFEETCESSVLWQPTSGNKDLTTVVGLAFGAGTPVFTFQASATATREFWVEDVGPRT